MLGNLSFLHPLLHDFSIEGRGPPALMRSWITSMISSTCACSMLVFPASPTSRATNLAQAIDWQMTSSSHCSKGSWPNGVVGFTVAQVLAGSHGGGILSSSY